MFVSETIPDGSAGFELDKEFFRGGMYSTGHFAGADEGTVKCKLREWIVG